MKGISMSKFSELFDFDISVSESEIEIPWDQNWDQFGFDYSVRESEMRIICKNEETERRCWWLNGKLHREDGPAVEWPNGNKEWWLNDKPYTLEEFLEKTPLSREEKIGLKLTYMTEFA